MQKERLKPVAFCGENPAIQLVTPDTDTISAAASYWRCTYSTFGEGDVLLLYLDAANAAALGQPTSAIYADNALLARYLTDTFNQHFEGWQDKGFASAAVQSARFYKQADVRQFYRLACHTEHAVIDLLWNEPREGEFRTFPDLNPDGFGVAKDEHYHVSAAFFLCEQGSIRVNNQLAVGEPQTRMLDNVILTSSIFVALSETWVKADVTNKE